MSQTQVELPVGAATSQSPGTSHSAFLFFVIFINCLPTKCIQQDRTTKAAGCDSRGNKVCLLPLYSLFYSFLLLIIDIYCNSSQMYTTTNKQDRAGPSRTPACSNVSTTRYVPFP